VLFPVLVRGLACRGQVLLTLRPPLAARRFPATPDRVPMDSSPPFLLVEHRAPGQPMRPLTVKLPAAADDLLRDQAQALGCYPTALARALLVRGLDQLQAAARGVG
jgi:hypothetical protein